MTCYCRLMTCYGRLMTCYNRLMTWDDRENEAPSLAPHSATAQRCALMNSVIFGHTISRQRRPEKMP